MAVIIATIVIIVIAFLPAISDVVDAITSGIARLKDLLASLDIPPEVGTAIDHATKGLQAWISSEISGLAGTVATVATVAILATFLTFFFMMDGDKAWGWAMASAKTWRREAIETAGDVALARVGGYLRGTAVIAAVDGFFEALFLFLLGVPNAPALGVIVFFGRFIPYIGGLVTTIILLFATLASAGQTAAVVLLVLIAILNVIQGKFLAPIVYHRTVHIHPALVLIALPAGAALAGIIGLFAAIPVVAFALAIVGAARVHPGRRTGQPGGRRATRWCPSGSTGSGSGAGGCSSRSAFSRVFIGVVVAGAHRRHPAGPRGRPGGHARSARRRARGARLEPRSSRHRGDPRGRGRDRRHRRADADLAGTADQRHGRQCDRRLRLRRQQHRRTGGDPGHARPDVRGRDPGHDRGGAVDAGRDRRSSSSWRRS